MEWFNTSNKITPTDQQFWEYFEPDGMRLSNLSVTSNVSLLTDTSLSVELTDGAGLVLAVYCSLLLAGALGNLMVLGTLARARRRRSRLDLLMTHLALADVCVTCGVIPLEIGWKYTNAWLAGNACCKLLLVMRAFGLYLSSNVLVCISVDRFFAVLYPLRMPVAKRRSKQMLYCAWAMALACSLPQSLVFRVREHPVVAGFWQCVSFDAFSHARHEVAYNVFCLCAMYFLPLAIISACYLRIFCEIRRSSRDLGECKEPEVKGRTVRLRRSDRRVLQRARRRTLRMTVTIVAVFALCWLPYATMAMWYMIDRESAQRVSERVQGLLFAMAVSNSCMNPLVYGSYCLGLRPAAAKLLRRACCVTAPTTDSTVHTRSTTSKKTHKIDASATLKKGNPRLRLGVRFAETPLSAPEFEGAKCFAPVNGVNGVTAARAPA